MLTADHVISANGMVNGGLAANIRIETRNPDGSLGAPVSRPVTRVWRQGKDANINNKWDLAVLQVSWGFVDTEFNLLAAARMNLQTFVNADVQLSSAGFGNTGALTTNGGPINVGYRHLSANPAHNDKKQRFWNQGITRLVDNYAAPGGYIHDSMEWILDNVDPNLNTGEGTGLPGDSGSPLLFTDRQPMGTGGTIQANTRGLRGVFNAFERIPFGAGNYDVEWGFHGYGVRITNEYRDWIEASCAMIPEPASMAAMAFGSLCVLIRRRRKPSA